MHRSPLLAVFRFHLRVGTRVAASVLLPALTLAVAVAMLLGPDFARDLSLALFGPRAGVASALLVLAMALAAAAVAERRVSTGLAGWLRHLPIASATHRRAAAAAILVAELPLLLLLAAAAALALPARTAAGAAAAAPLAALPIVGLSAALVTLRLRRRAAVVLLALAAGVLAGLGSWRLVAAALPLLAVADLAAGELAPVRAATPSRRSAGSPLLSGSPITSGSPILSRLPLASRSTLLSHSPWSARSSWSACSPFLSRSLLPARIALRALGWRLVQLYALAALPWLAAALFIANNRLAAPYPTRAALLGGASAGAVLLAALAEALVRRRPAWPWARSLPWSARRRVVEDAVLLGALCLPLVVLTAGLAPAAVLPLAGLLPLLALRAARAVRQPPGSRRGPAGEVLSEGLLLAGLLALLPWAAWALLAAVPWGVVAAADRERRQKVSSWRPTDHLAVGDPQYGSGG